jgi:hypothetical protein
VHLRFGWFWVGLGLNFNEKPPCLLSFGFLRLAAHDVERARSTHTALLAKKAQRQTIIAGDVASAVEDENRIRALKEYETLRDKLLKQKKKYERD